MKLYQWRPQGHGEHTFSTVAQSEEEAFSTVDVFVKKAYGTFYEEYPERKMTIGLGEITIPSQQNHWHYGYEAACWGTDYYKLEVYEMGQVAEHEND